MKKLWDTQRIERWLDNHWVLSDVKWARRVVHKAIEEVQEDYLKEIEKSSKNTDTYGYA